MKPPYSECPDCGCEEYYTKDRVSGSYNPIYAFNGEFLRDEGYHQLKEMKGKWAYCADCHKRLFKIED